MKTLVAFISGRRSTALLLVAALAATTVVAFAGEPSRTSEAAVERPIVATDAICFGLVVTDVAVAAPVRRLDPPSLFPAGVGWDVERGAIVDTALGTFLIGWEPNTERGDVEVNFAVLRPSGRPFASGSSGGLRQFSATARLGVASPSDVEVTVVGGVNESYVLIDDPAAGAVHILRLIPDRITSTGAVDPEADVFSIGTNGVTSAVGAARELWLTTVDPDDPERYQLQVVVFGLADGPQALTVAEQLASADLVRVDERVVGQQSDGQIAQWQVDATDDDVTVAVVDTWPLPEPAGGIVEAASVRGSNLPALLVTRADGDLDLVTLTNGGDFADVRTFPRPGDLEVARGVMAGPQVSGVVGIGAGDLTYWLAGNGDEQLSSVEAPGDPCSVRNEPVAQRILEPIAGGDLVFLHYPDRQADCVINLPKGNDCLQVDRSTGGIPRPNLAAISEFELPETDFDPVDEPTQEPERDEPEEVELDLVGESVSSDPCDIVDPARILIDGRPEITSLQAEGAGFSLAWWWNTSDDGCVPSGYEFARVANGQCSTSWPSSPSARITIHVDVERSGFATTWDAEPGEQFAVYVRGLVDGQDGTVGNVDCRQVRIPVSHPPAPSSFSASPSGDNWSLSWSFSCVIAASCGGERFEVTMSFCSGSARQSFTTAETSLTIPVDDSLVGQVVQFSVVTLRDGDGEVLRSDSASVGCSESVRPPRDGSPGDMTLSAPAGGNLQLSVAGDARTALVRLLGTSQLDGLTVSASRGDTSASGSGGFGGGGSLSADLGTPRCFGAAWSISFSVSGRSIDAGSLSANCNTAISGASLAVTGSGTTLQFTMTVNGLGADLDAGATLGTYEVKCAGISTSSTPSGGSDNAVSLQLELPSKGCLTTEQLSAQLTIDYPGDTPSTTLTASASSGSGVADAIFAASKDALLADGLGLLSDEYDADVDFIGELFPVNNGSFTTSANTDPADGCDPDDVDPHQVTVTVVVALGGLSTSGDTTVGCVPPPEEPEDPEDGENGEGEEGEDNGEGGENGEGGGTGEDNGEGEDGGEGGGEEPEEGNGGDEEGNGEEAGGEGNGGGEGGEEA